MGERVPRVSVTMPFLDAEEFIDEAIASVMAQSTDDFELLLCDDGSTDRSTAIAVEWAARRPSHVRYLEHPGHVNKGMSATRNLGFGAGRSEFVAFIDADDVWRPGKLAEQLALMDAHPDVDMVCGTVRYWGSWNGGPDALVPTGHVQNRVVHPPELSLALYPLGPATAPGTSDMLLRREAVEAIGRFEEEFPGFYEDQAFFSKLYLASSVYISSSVWLDYRQHSGSCSAVVSRSGGYDTFRQQFLVWFEDYLDGLPDVPPRKVRSALSRALRPYRRPMVHAVMSAPARFRAKARGGVRRIGRMRRRWSREAAADDG